MNLTCQQTLHSLPDYLNGRLAATDAQEIQQHISHCRECAAIVASARLTLKEFFDPDAKRVEGMESCPA